MEKITRDNFYPQISYSLLLTAAVTVPWSRFLMLPIAILLLVLFVADCRYRLHFQTLHENKLLLPFLSRSRCSCCAFSGRPTPTMWQRPFPTGNASCGF